MWMLAKSGVESLLMVLIGDDSPVDAAEGEGDIGSPSRSPGEGDGGEERFDEGGVISPASSAIKARRSPVDRFIVSGLCSGDESPEMSGDLEPCATGVLSPSVEPTVASSELSMACENDSQGSALPLQLLLRS